MNPGNAHAAEIFKDVNEAYQVLSDENLRKKYNRKHFVYSIKGILTVNNIKSRIDESGMSEFVEMFIGKPFVKKSKEKNSNVSAKGEDLESEISITLNEAFNGVNKKVSFKGYDDKVRTITVKIPGGIANGGKLRIKGQGKPNKTSGEVGDLFIKINIIEDKRFKLEKKDLIVDLPLTPSEAVLGCNLSIDGIDTKVDINIKPGTESGETICVNGKGYFGIRGERGDLLVKTKIVIPKNVSKKEKELYEELQKITSFVPR